MKLTEQEINELRFALFNLDSPSKKEAREIVERWKIKLTLELRKIRPVPRQTVNVD